jgi:hypothetical protein
LALATQDSKESLFVKSQTFVSILSFYRKAKIEINKETKRMNLTELLYLTTKLRKAEGSNSLEKQITGSGKTKTKQTRLLRPD